MTTVGEGRHAWRSWPVAPGFEVDSDSGHVCLAQVDDRQFVVHTPFRYSDEAVVAEMVDVLVLSGRDRVDAERLVDQARTFTPSDENPTDLASIPPFVRWFENTYGRHTLAAILHDTLITATPNAGALGSDTLADRFFRQMLGSVGVPRLKRWVVWAAVALRTRWAAGGLRRVSVCVWACLAALGIAALAVACLQQAGVIGPFDVLGQSVGSAALFGLAAALPFVAAPLWGGQYGASLVAAVAAPFLLPAVLFALVGGLVYVVLEDALRVGERLLARLTHGLGPRHGVLHRR